MIAWIVILNVIGFGRFVNLKGPMELIEMDHFFQCLACLEIIFSKTHGVVRFGGLDFFFICLFLIYKLSLL
jgi:hypothetical protein